jgi:Flp pilus assembly protein CpaB
VSFGGNDTDSGMLAYAQVSVPNARVLSIGPITQMSVDKAKNEAARTTPDAPAASDGPAPINTLPAVSPNLGPKDPAEMTAFLRELRSAVLAIPEADVPRLMLAAYSGQLRLALRPYSLTQTEPDAVSGRLKPAESIANQRLTILRPELAPNASVGRRLKATSGGQVVIQEGSNERKLPPEEQ